MAQASIITRAIQNVHYILQILCKTEHNPIYSTRQTTLF